MLQPLTPKEKTVLEFIESFLADNGFAPTFTEIKENFGFASYNSVQKYLKQLQKKNYIYIPGGNQKRAISILHSSLAVQNKVHQMQSPNHALTDASVQTFIKSSPSTRETSTMSRPSSSSSESLSLPILGRVAAGQPLEALDHDSYIDIPQNMIKPSKDNFALKVEGQSMIEDGILDGDIILVQSQTSANNGEIAVASIDNEATVKRIFLDEEKNQYELRPANSEMSSMWYNIDEVEIKGIVTGLIRKFQ